MKKLLIMQIAMLMCLGGHAQMNPLVDSLVKEVEALNKRSVYYTYHLLPYEVIPRCYYRIQHQVHAPWVSPVSSNAMRFKPKYDSLYSVVHPREARIADAIRNTCWALAQDAQESHMWEYHQDGLDSLKYAIKIGGQDYDVTKRLPHARHIDAPNSVKYIYRPDGAQWYFEGGDEKGLPHHRYGEFEYEFVPDSVSRTPRPIDVKDFSRYIRPILKRDGIKSHRLYIRADSSLAKLHPEVKMLYTAKYYGEPPYGEEMRGMVYAIESEEQAEAVLDELNHATMTYIEHHKDMICEYYKRNYFDINAQLMLECFIPDKKFPDGRGREYKIFYKYVYDEYDNKKFYFVVMDTDRAGQYVPNLPYEWQNMKSWVNGKVTYYKKK